MNAEIIFLVEEAPEGGYLARALGHAIFTEGDSVASLHENVKDALRCHFEDAYSDLELLSEPRPRTN